MRDPPRLHTTALRQRHGEDASVHRLVRRSECVRWPPRIMFKLGKPHNEPCVSPNARHTNAHRSRATVPRRFPGLHTRTRHRCSATLELLATLPGRFSRGRSRGSLGCDPEQCAMLPNELSLSPSGPNLADIVPNLAELGPQMAAVLPELADSGQNLAEFCRRCLKSGRLRPKFGRNGHRFG